jgi:hypothetical protein
MDGQEPKPKMRSINKLWQLFDDYVEAVENSSLALKSQEDYREFAEYFVRWIEGDYTPGQGIKDS